MDVMTNCTAEETEKYIIKKHGHDCQEGGFCRFVRPDTYYCECQPGWCGSICSEGICHHPSQDSTSALLFVQLPLLGILLLLILVTAILFVYFARRKVRKHESCPKGGGVDFERGEIRCPKSATGRVGDSSAA